MKDNKSSNMRFLTGEKNVRPVSGLVPGKTNHNLGSVNNFDGFIKGLMQQSDLLNTHVLNGMDKDVLARLVASNTVLPPVHPPAPSKNPFINS